MKTVEPLLSFLSTQGSHRDVTTTMPSTTDTLDLHV